MMQEWKHLPKIVHVKVTKMDREQREKLVIESMQRGMPFEAIYQESDGIPFFHYWVYEPTKSAVMTERMSKSELNDYVATLIPGTTFKRVDRLGYTLDF